MLCHGALCQLALCQWLRRGWIGYRAGRRCRRHRRFADRIGIGTDFTQGHGGSFFEWLTRDKGYARTLTDFDEIKFPDGFSTIGDFPNLTAAMERAGWTATRIGNILGLNWLRLLDEVWAP